MEEIADDRPGGPEPTTAAPPVRRLRRSTKGQIGGIATGLATYLGVQPLFFRIAFIILTLFSGFGVVLYAASWLLLPADDDPDRRPLAVTSNTPALVAGFALLAIGSLLVGNGVTVGPNIVIPIVLIVFGSWVLNQRRESGLAASPMVAPPVRPQRVAPFGSAPEPFAPEAVPMDPALESTGAEADPTVSAIGFAADRDEVSTAPGLADSFGPQSALSAPAPTTGNEHWARARLDGPELPQAPQGPPVTSITLAASVVTVGALLVLRNLGGFDINATVVLASVLAVFGAGIVASSFFGRAVALVLLTILIAPLLLVAPLIDSTLGGGIGARDIQVSGSGAELEDSYSLGLGQLELDLSRLELTTDERVEIDVGAGYAEIVVPANLEVRVTATNRAGYVEVGGRSDEGLFNELNRVMEGAPGTTGSLTLIIDVTFGYVEVTRG